MRLWQEAEADVFGLGGVNTWQQHFAKTFEQYDSVFVILDNEEPYDNPQAAEAVEKAWKQIRTDIGSKARRLRLPAGVKDVCEFFESGFDMSSLRTLVKKGRSLSRFNPLDLTKDPPPVDWLFEGLVARGDVTLGSGASNLGKSWISMGMTVALTEGWEYFLGQRVSFKSQRVLYIDEENPEDVVYSRLNRLGFRTHENLRYLWNNGIRLDRHADILLEEALDFEPDLIVLDSFTRIHNQEENSVGDMAPLLNDCIKPLARETGAAVFLIHHHDKSAIGPRGSSDIISSVDGALDAFSTGVPGQFRLRLSKSRRRLIGEEKNIKIVDMPDGTVQLQSIENLEPPF